MSCASSSIGPVGLTGNGWLIGRLRFPTRSGGTDRVGVRQCAASAKLVKENELVSDRTSFRLPAALIFGGQLLFIAAGIFHPGSVPPNDHPAVFAEYATSAYWGAVHMGQFVGL